jgi:MFS family permease
MRATVTNFFFFLSLNGFALLPLDIQQLGGTEVEIGLIMGLYSAVGIICQPLIGPWVDALGRRPFMLAGVGLVLVSTLLAIFGRALGWLAVVRLLQGVGFSAFFVANYSYVLDLVPPSRRGRALGLYGVSGLLATALAPLAGEWLIRRLGFPPLFALCALLTVIALALVWGMRERRREGWQPVRGADWARTGIQEVFRRHMAVTLFFGLGTGTIFAFLPTFGESMGVTTLALFYTAYAAAAMGVRIVGGGLIDTHGRRAVIVPSMFVQIAAAGVLAALGLLSDPGSRAVLPALLVAGLLSGGAHGLLYPALSALVADQVRKDRRGTVVGVFSAVFLVGNTAGAFTFGYVTHAIGYGPMWAVLSGLLLIGAALSLDLADRAPATA